MALSETLPAMVERACAPLDRARRAGFSLILRNATLKAVVVRKDRRIFWLMVLHGGLVLVLSARFPVLLFVLGPIVLGVPHVASDLRYLVLRRELPSWWKWALLGGSAAFVGLRALELLGFGRLPFGIELALFASWAATGIIAAGIGGKVGALPRAYLAFAALAAFLSVAQQWPREFRLVFVHLHNVVAIAVWLLLFRVRRFPVALPLLLLLAGAAWLASGAAYRSGVLRPLATTFGLHPLQVADVLAPGLRVDFALGLTSAFVFLQSVHYLLWLHVIPQEDARSDRTLTFTMSARSLFRDFGQTGTVAIAGSALAVLVAAWLAPARTRTIYTALAMFHGYLELVLLGYYWVRGPLPLVTHGTRP